MHEYSQHQTDRSRILFVYGYHEDEVFHQEVTLELQKEDLSHVRFVKYEGKRIPREKDITSSPFTGFVRRYFPFDYAIDLHDSPDAVDFTGVKEKLIMPCFMCLYHSKIPVSKGLKEDLEKYRNELEERHKRWVEVHYLLPTRDAPSRYAIINIELFPHYVTKNDSVEFLKGLINILYRHPHRRV